MEHACRLEGLGRPLLKKAPTDAVTRIYVGIIADLIAYFTVILVKPHSTNALVMGAEFSLLALFLASFVWLLVLNGSISPALVVIRRPKTWLILIVLFFYFVAVAYRPTFGLRSQLDALGFVFIYVAVIFFDAMIDRPRGLVFAFLVVLILATAIMIYDWVFTDLATGTVLFTVFGSKVMKRQTVRSTLFTLLLQLLEGVLFMIKAVVAPSRASLHQHFSEFFFVAL